MRIMDILQDFKDRVFAFMRETGVKPTVLGWEALHDGNFINTLEGGREPKNSTMMKVERWMNDYREQKAREKELASGSAE